MPHANESTKEKKENHHHSQAPQKKVILPAGIQEGYDPFTDPSLSPAPAPSAAPPIQIPNNPLEQSGGSGSSPPKNYIESPLNGMETATPAKPIIQSPKSPANNAVIGVPGPAKPLVKNNNNVKQPQQQQTPGKSPPPLKLVSPDGEDMEKAVPIQLEDGLEEQEYFHGLLPREDIEAFLRQDGDFVLRVTELRESVKKATRELCLSVYWKGNVHHYLLRPNTYKRYQICNPTSGERVPEFENVNEMINHYMDGKIIFSNHQVVLRTPICRQEWELRHKEITCKLKLGCGAFGEVYSGSLKRKNKKSVKVAIKMLKGDKIDKKKILEIMGEARVMRPLKHKNVVRCFGVAADIEPLMIVMELINGGALDVYLRCNTNKVSMEKRVNMAFDAALGLEFVHSKNILHRDIAARNCLYDSKALKVSDFGLSIVGEKHNLTANEKAPIRWLAPEVFRTHTYTRPSDVWAFGVLVWEIFNDAQEPYKGWTGTQIRDSVLQFGNKLQMPDWAGPHLAKLVNDIFEPEPSTRISMSDAVKRIEKIAPKREREEEEEESQDDSNKRSTNKNNNNAKGGKPNKPSRLPFNFFEKPKDLPKSDREPLSEGHSKRGKTSSTLSSVKPSIAGKSTKSGKKGLSKEPFSKEPFSKFGKSNSKDLLGFSKESKKDPKKKKRGGGGGST
uniref:Tyrosine-protein kinase n=1 Tax=Panagrolaimus superbus TaxID=310955 RepID=A0A914XWX3_9BILA